MTDFLSPHVCDLSHLTIVAPFGRYLQDAAMESPLEGVDLEILQNINSRRQCVLRPSAGFGRVMRFPPHQCALSRTDRNTGEGEEVERSRDLDLSA